MSMTPAAGDITPAATRASAYAAAITATDQSTYDAANAASQVAAQESHFWRGICAWTNQSTDGDALRATSETFMCEDTSLVSAGWLTAAEAALVAQGFVVVRDAAARTFTVSQS